jgi:hypothetical protein
MKSYLPNIRPGTPGKDEKSTPDEARCCDRSNLKIAMPFWSKEISVLPHDSKFLEAFSASAARAPCAISWSLPTSKEQDDDECGFGN